MRNLSAGALAKIATKQGTEPLVFLEIDWVGDGSLAYYGDKSEGVVLGAIAEVSGLDEVVQVSGGGSSQQITVTLDDAALNGELKAIYDSVDIHKKPVRVWQWFTGMDFSDKFLLFKGQINSPVTWDEGTRRLTFTVVNRIEDVEVGFSAEEGEFYQLPEDLIGVPWPLCFGTTINVPALKAVPAISGQLASGVGIHDFTLRRRIDLAEDLVCTVNLIGWGKLVPVMGAGYFATPIYEADPSCVQQRCTEIERLRLMYSEQRAYEYATITVFGGEKFPQNTRITLDINGGRFTGYFGAGGDPQLFTIQSRLHPRNDGSNNVRDDSEAETEIRSQCEAEARAGSPKSADAIDDGKGWWYYDPELGLGLSPPDSVLKARSSRISWDAYRNARSADFFWAGGGSTVTLADNNEITWIANIIPSTILRVAAWRVLDGNRFLLTVPEEFYEVRQTDYNGYDVMEIVMTKPLSVRNKQEGGGWEDQIYITQTASVGPNTVDIIRWFIETYTEYAIDAASFNATEALVEVYPMHFPMLTRKNLITVLHELSTLARCALWMKDDTFYIRYLSAEPAPVGTIDEGDILPDSLSISLTSTEDVVTKFVAKWRRDYSEPRSNTLILRHNVKAYGTHDKTYDYYAFNILELVRKTATFWVIRRANCWRRVSFSTPLTKLNFEAFDAITLTLSDLSDGPVISIVEKAVYNSDQHQIDFECWTPVLSGTRVPYDYAFPAGIAERALFPRIEERDAGKAGSGTLPNFTVIAPIEHPLRGTQNTGSGGSINLDDREDHGDPAPSDIGDVKPEPTAVSDTTGAINASTSPFSGNITNGFFNPHTAAVDAAKQAQSAAGRAKEDAERANNAGNNDDRSDSQADLGHLDDPTEGKTDDELAEDCLFVVNITMVRVNSVSKQSGSLGVSRTPGDAGRAAQSDFDEGHKIVFDSRSAAISYIEDKQAEWRALFDSWGFVVGESYELVNGFTPGGSDSCVEPEGGGGIVGYHQGAGPAIEL